MRQSTPADRDRAQRRVRSITVGSAVGAGVLTLVGAAVTAGTFAGRTVASPSSATPPAAAPTLDPTTGLLPPPQAPTDSSGLGGSNGGSANPPVVSGGS
ncbi:MAG TPA: hypothetical protein VG520_01965 [Candidatus Dormibacteraeota bacterium]|jgi:hypothetical protein|nr:hypothetical protein [Candidatus Dormibacteraeota bacterium]